MAFYNREPRGGPESVCVINPNFQSARFRDDTHKIQSAVAFRCGSTRVVSEPRGTGYLVPCEPTKISELEETITAKIKKVAEETNICKFSL